MLKKSRYAIIALILAIAVVHNAYLTYEFPILGNAALIAGYAVGCVMSISVWLKERRE